MRYSTDKKKTGTGTITDNDTSTYTIDNLTKREADDSMPLSFPTRRSSDLETKVNVSFADVSTSAGDFAHATQQVTFAANSTTAQTVTVTITDDNIVEAKIRRTHALTPDT